MMILYILLLILICAYIIKSLIKQGNYWKNRNVKQLQPLPIVGNNLNIFLRKESFFDYFQRLYNAAPNDRYFGIYLMSKPTLLLRDPELIKQITVKDFEHFTDHEFGFPEDVDKFWAKNLLALRGTKWKDMRSTLSPAFTSTKMRAMFTLMNETAQQFIDYYIKNDQKTITLDLKDSFTRYANDVIANCAYGVQCNSLIYKENEFYLQGKEATSITGFWRNFQMLIGFISPSLQKILKPQFFPESTVKFFHKIITDTMKIRKEQNIVRPDMVHLLMECQKETENYNEKEYLTDIDITANAMIFFFGGFDTVSTALSFMSYEMAINQEIQKRLQKEIDNLLATCKGKLEYNHVMEMKYLDMVVSETLRKWPPFMSTDRVCTIPYTIEPTKKGEPKLELKVGDNLIFPTIAIQHDPNLFPEPEKFDPERFNNKNNETINPYAYLAFGIGPRKCVASRFALMEIKTIMVHILSKFNIVPVAESTIPVQISKEQMILKSENGMWLGLEKRLI